MRLGFLRNNRARLHCAHFQVCAVRSIGHLARKPHCADGGRGDDCLAQPLSLGAVARRRPSALLLVNHPQRCRTEKIRPQPRKRAWQRSIGRCRCKTTSVDAGHCTCTCTVPLPSLYWGRPLPLSLRRVVPRLAKALRFSPICRPVGPVAAQHPLGCDTCVGTFHAPTVAGEG